MSPVKNNRIDTLRERCETRAEFAQHLRSPAYRDVTLSEMRQATQLLRGYSEPMARLKVAVLGSYTTELLRDYWVFHGLLHAFDLDLYFAPFGNVVQEFQDGSGLSRHAPDFTYLLLQWVDIVPALADPLHALDDQERRELCERFETGLADLISTAQQAPIGTLVLSFLPNARPPDLGLYDAMAASSEALLRWNLSQKLAALLNERFQSVYADEGTHLLSILGSAGLFDARLWHTGRFPFSTRGAYLFTERLFRFPVLLRKPKIKCIVLDCDNTLWGGIIGEDGLAGIDLGPDYPGSCYVAFQRRLLGFLRRGILLAICSKNNLDDVQRVIREHPHMCLQDEHFAAIRVSWDSKPDNIRAIAKELRLGLDSFMFVDDSPYECRMMHKYVPEVSVVQVPEKPLDLPGCLDGLQELELLSFTAEDRNRSKMYIQNRQRLELAVSSRDISEYLTSLQMRMQIRANGHGHVARLTQMTQKTNQFNLTTRRYSESDIQAFMQDSDWLVMHFSLSDIFGDNGIVGLALISGMTTDSATIDSFLLSCRVIGRKAEEAFLYQILRLLRDLGKTAVSAFYIPTAKNSLVQEFWDQQGFISVGDGVYEFDLATLSESHPALEHFKIIVEENSK